MTGQSKLNNEAVIDDKMRQRLNNLYAIDYNAEQVTKKLHKVDKNMYVKVMDFNEHYIQVAEQMVYNTIVGNAIKDNMDLYYELENEGKKPLLIQVNYDNLITGNKAQFTLVNIIKMNGLYYVRDRSNFRDECKELGWWFLDRQQQSNTKSIGIAHFIKTGEKETTCKFTPQTKYIHGLLDKNTATLCLRKKLKPQEIEHRKIKTLQYNHKGNRVR